MRKKQIVFSSLFIFFSLLSYSQTKAFKFNVEVKVTMPGFDSTGAVIRITKNGKLFKTIQSQGIKYPVELDLNATYLFKCSKKGYVTKTVLFDTKVPKGREVEEFAKFVARVELHKTTGAKVDSSKPVGGVKYSDAAGDFDFYKN